MLKVAIIIGSTRPGRKAEAVAHWVHDIAWKRSDASFEVVDIASFDLPLLDEALPPSMGQYAQPHTKAWAAKIATFDGIRVRHAGVQSFNVRRAQERDRLSLSRMERQGGGFCRLWRHERSAGGRAAATDYGRDQDCRRARASRAVAFYRFRELLHIQTRPSSGGDGHCDARRPSFVGSRTAGHASATQRATMTSRQRKFLMTESTTAT